MAAPDWNQADIEFVKEVVRTGEEKLTAQLQIAISADQRAAVLAGVFSALAIGLAAALATIFGSLTHPVIIGGGVAAVVYVFAAVLCVGAIFPVDIYPPGLEPDAWYDDLNEKKVFKLALGQYAENISADIERNRLMLERNAKWFQRGAFMGLFSPIVGATVFAICQWAWVVAAAVAAAGSHANHPF